MNFGSNNTSSSDPLYLSPGQLGTLVVENRLIRAATSESMAHDDEVRGQLEDLGFRVIVIRHDKSMQDQVADHPNDFGQGGQA